MAAVGGVPSDLVTELQRSLSLGRAVETGTYKGTGTRILAEAFPSVVTVELSEELARSADEALRDLTRVRAVHGDSRAELPQLAAERVPTLWFLDGHWSGGQTAGQTGECPVLDEIAALGRGHADDCVVVDDARLFAAAPPPPHDPSQWPTLMEVFDALRAVHPSHHVTLLNDQVLAVPPQARPLLNAYGQQLAAGTAADLRLLAGRLAGPGVGLLSRSRARLRRS